MKKPRVLPYSWEDLTSQTQIDNYFVDKVRMCLCAIKANSATPALHFIVRLINEMIEYIITCPKSDACVVLYRLFQQFDVETIKTTIIGQAPSYLIKEEPQVSMLEFMVIVEMAHVKSPVPIVMGHVPQVNL